MPRRYYLEDLALDEAQQRFEQALRRAGGIAASTCSKKSTKCVIERLG